MIKPSAYKTRQREAILNYMIDNTGDIVTVRMIDEYFKNLKTPIGIATIYRHLDDLAEQGVISRYTIEGIAGACFEYNKKDEAYEHAHLMCEGCGNLTDLDCDFLDNINTHLLKEHRFNVNPQKMVFYGKCKECMSKRSE